MKTRRFFLLMLVATLVLSSLVGCGKKDTGTVSKNDPDEKITIDYWVPFNSSQYIPNLNESEMYKELEERTGVHVKFTHPSEEETLEQFYLMLNKKELPDVIQTYPAEYKGGVDKAIEDGVYVRLNELIAEHAPNYQKLLDGDPELERQVTTDAGNIYAFHLVGIDEEEPAWWGPVFRGDWLEELDLEIPETIDEWYNVLTQFKEKKDAQAPLTMSASGIDPYGTLVSAYGIGPSFYNDNGSPKYGPIQPEFKEYLTTMNKWYSEGLLDKDFATRDSGGRDAVITSGETGAYLTEYALIDKYLAAIQSTDSDVKFVAAEIPTLEKGDNAQYRVVNTRSGGYEAAITTSAKNPEAIVKWFDYAYSEEGFNLFNYGIEGVSYEMVDGEPEFTDLLANNPDGLDYWTVSNKYKLDVGPYLRDYKAIAGGFTENNLDAMEQWTKAGTDLVLPPIKFTPEEDEIYSDIMSDIATYKEEMVLKFIVGEEPLSKFDDYVEEINRIGIADVEKIYQDSLDRYNNR